MSRMSLAEQLKQLEGDAPKSIDPESAYSALDSQDRTERDANEGREHYVDVGPSRLRAAAGADTAQTLLTEKYGGKASSRMKIFDDDDDEEEQPEEEAGFDDEDDEEEDDDEDDEDDEDEDEDEDEEDEDDDEDEDDAEEPAPSGRTLDPLGALRASRAKDVEKGAAIKRQKDLFDQLLTVRITFQKALAPAFQIPEDVEDPAGEVADKRVATLQSLAKLSDSLFSLRRSIQLPGTEAESKKRKRTEDDITEPVYWEQSAADSLSLVDAAHPALIPLLNKWSTKIQAATLQLGSKAAGGSKFMQSARGVVGVVDAIDASLAQRRDNLKPLLEGEEGAYRALLREVIESRQGSGNVDLSHLRREKKKKREAERGGSKGRKLRYTIHDKSVNFVVPIPLEEAWHEEQVDELFASLFGGVGKAGAVSDMGVADNNAATDLGGLRVF